ncbi:hypothetical protein SLS63_008501 [Diaporthe eres]|uniref:Uncharacterized protein n=1 Tax=Diaporthe eres TaxID=83184 RepID=A0ABR1P2L0_DIAER
MSTSGNSSFQGANINNIFGAFGSLLGYIGAEAITKSCFERLLWPQRSWSNFGLAQLPWVALLTPMGGPMHKAALDVFDIVYRHGLFKGAQQGHMLGTTFFPDLRWTSTMYYVKSGSWEEKRKDLRNCIWVRAMALLALPELGNSEEPTLPTPDDLEVGHQEFASHRRQKRLVQPAPVAFRAYFRVSHLTLAAAAQADRTTSSNIFVGETPGNMSRNIVLAILTGELSAIATATAVAVRCRSLWALMWLLPLTLRLISAALALQRTQLEQPPRNGFTIENEADEKICHLEVHYPQSEGHFLVISGPEKLVMQFTRHYGHPVRNRFREIVQLAAVAVYACLFPAELVCSTIWMPVQVQYAWLSYQLYVVL